VAHKAPPVRKALKARQVHVVRQARSFAAPLVLQVLKARRALAAPQALLDLKVTTQKASLVQWVT
jgi:hypothetical protein